MPSYSESVQLGLSSGTSRDFPSITVAAGALLVAGVSWDNTATCSLSDDNGNTWTAIGSPEITPGSARVQLFRAPDCASGATVVTATWSTGSPNSTGALHEVSGAAASGELDANSSDNGTSTSADSGNMTTSEDDVYIFSYTAVDALADVSVGTGFTARETIAALGSDVAQSQDDNTNSAGTNSATASISSSVGWGCCAAAFKSPSTTKQADVAFNGSGTVAAAARKTGRGEAAISGSGDLGATARKTGRASAAFSGAGTLGAVSRRTRNENVAFSGAGELSGTGRKVARATVSMTGSAVLVVDGQQQGGGGGGGGPERGHGGGSAKYTGAI